ncbi:MAG: circularly permuted type 2 ATP-grasp protein, partial [Methyloceanibacter sp.]
MPQDTDTLSAGDVPADAAEYYQKFFNEMRDAHGNVRPAYKQLAKFLDGLSMDSLATKQEAADALFRRLGITFAVYSEGGSTERLIPFDLIPRILHQSEWNLVERGCLQRVKAINMFLYDIYHDQEILKAELIPS